MPPETLINVLDCVPRTTAHWTVIGSERQSCQLFLVKQSVYTHVCYVPRRVGEWSLTDSARYCHDLREPSAVAILKSPSFLIGIAAAFLLYLFLKNLVELASRPRRIRQAAAPELQGQPSKRHLRFAQLAPPNLPYAGSR